MENASGTLTNLKYELDQMCCCTTSSQIAARLDVDERVLKYKLEAIRMRGKDIDRQEIERYDRMFRDVRSARAATIYQWPGYAGISHSETEGR